MLESKLERAICKYARSRRCLVYKFSSPNRRGVPDRIIISPSGKILFLEIKAPGKDPTKLQIHEMMTLTGHGCFATYVDNLPAAKRQIDKLFPQ